MTGRKYEKPLYLDMDFDEALERFGTTDPDEVKEAMERAKEKKPPGTKAPAAKKARRKVTPSSRTKKRSAG